MDGEKQCLILGNKNAITYKEIFPLIKENKLWIGYTSTSLDILFTVPKELEENLLSHKEGSAYRIINGQIYARSASIWYTNIDHGRRHKPLQLMTMEDNIRFNKAEYPHYDYYDAINVAKTMYIPSDYDGIMGVPISFLDKYCPEQFEIIDGIGRYSVLDNERTKKEGKYLSMINGDSKFFRIIIRKKQ